ERRVTLLTGALATREAVLRALGDVAEQARPRDAVLLYVSTHGTLGLTAGGGLEPVFVLQDTESQMLDATGLPESLLRRELDRVPAARKILVKAACQSGLGKSRLTPKVQELVATAKGRPTPLADVSESVLVLSAAARGETATEDDKL